MTPKQVAEYMLGQDYFSQWMNIRLIEIKENYCLIEMPVKKEMINGLKTVHGGVTFAFADSALAFSSNNSGDAAVALNCVINFTKAGKEGDVFRAESILANETRKTAIYDIKITNQNDELIAKFVGTVYKIGKKVTEL
ncbi:MULTISPECIES: PaaI family thioesterase [Chryseobacterium]|uniref:Acyl-CoA thioesterase n=1 Tax=Chryseobacterium camelliae TaxID=1265445 RepID=A0ABU0TNY8_9FLAO|nr:MULTISPECIES: hotdog fold thioesterase [Chryseobacterium]MDT3407402.1 acyl-CoA thioesterase [Pseudacidovorax intermedius]MDQ1098749.1 acyl-CoA thioesterase [Chryseobacterium camelliae]MDQ1102673.1 acyl-CoA thioesterase [Chryseobacterium sp. SORGH_AS_1048]MDR6086101.1 acyl-CoA thioesterase [Chryseobacterium sp. SORGH_AS_0909]MDR6130471.1 acyl-CoA thioesterase [Chryseobacterium sp. SORGH_AS_1175]